MILLSLLAFCLFALLNQPFSLLILEQMLFDQLILGVLEAALEAFYQSLPFDFGKTAGEWFCIACESACLDLARGGVGVSWCGWGHD